MPSSPPELLAAVGPRVRTSPFFDATVTDGLTAVSTYNHMWLPMGYGDPDAEYERLTTGVAMWDVAAQRHVEVRGPDADALVQAATVIDATAVPAGGGAYAPVLDHAATLINDPVLLRLDDGSWRFSIADADLRLWLSAISAARGLDATVTELDTATLAVQGPLAWEVGGALGVADLRGAEHLHHQPTHVGDIAVRICRSGWSSQGGFELFLDDTDRALALWSAVRDAGRPWGIGPGAPNPAERIEHVLLSYGTDTGYDAHPDEVGLADVVDLDGGGDFVGRDALVALRQEGLGRHLLGVVLDGEPIDVLWRPVPLLVDGEERGELRAAAWSPRFGTNLGLGLVGRSLAPGQRGEVDVPEGRRRADLVPVPFEDVLPS